MTRKPTAADARPSDTLFPLAAPLSKFSVALGYLLEDRSLEDVSAATGLRPLAIRQHLNGSNAPTPAERAAYAQFFGWTPAEFERQIRLWGSGSLVQLTVDRQVAERLDEQAVRAGVTLEQFIARLADGGVY